MTSPVDVKKLVKPFLEHNPSFVLSGRWLAMRPVEHFMVGICIDRTGSADNFRPLWVVGGFFYPWHRINLSFGADIFPKEKGLWRLSNPDEAHRLAARMEEEALPLLRPLTSFERVCDFMLTHRFHWGPVAQHPSTRVLLAIAQGDWETAAKICAELSAHYQKFKATRDLSELEPIILILAPLVAARDRAAIAKVLHGWEAITIKNYKLEKYWVPTPFPLESAG